MNPDIPDFIETDPDLMDDPEAGLQAAAQASKAGPLLTYDALSAQVNKLEKKLSEAQSAIDTYKNQLLRQQADTENMRKRAEKEADHARKYALESFISKLLPVIDSLEHGLRLEVGDNTLAQQIHAGLEMTLKLLLDTLAKSNVTLVDPMGQLFDHNVHQAISTQENNDVPENTILQVLQRGYMLNDRLVRPALVIVSKRT